MKMKKSIRALLMLFVVTVLMLGCEKSKDVQNPIEETKIKVITSLFPQYDFVREIAKDKVEVELLLPPGMESHAYEPTPQDMMKIKKADLFIYTGEAMEPWAHKIIETLKSERVVVVDISKGIDFLEHAHEEDTHGHEEDTHGHEEDTHGHEEDTHGHEEDTHEGDTHAHEGVDPHIWLDPVHAQQIVKNIVKGLTIVDSKNEIFYKDNAIAYNQQLEDLDLLFQETFQRTKTRTILYGGHFAFGYFAKRYGLEYVSPYRGFSPDAEPTPQRIAELIKTMKASETKVIYYEELIDPKVARVIAEETGAIMLMLHGAHNVTKKEMDAGLTYMQIMKENIEKLKQGLGYE
jgi:zinc transport system substrate-binding protein